MRRLGIIMLLLQFFVLMGSAAAKEYLEVVVEDPYLELHTGPGRGYPVFHVVDRGDSIEILKRRTDWFKVRTDRGTEGWVKRGEMEKTLQLDGERMKVRRMTVRDYQARRWEMGVMGGDFDGANMLTAYGGFGFSPNLSLELSGSRGLGDYSNNWMANLTINHLFFPEWRVSPFFSLGTGVVHVEPKSTLVQSEDRTDQHANVGGGVRAYLTRRFVLRGEFRHFVIFTDRDDNEEIDAWQAGFSVFF